MTRPEYVLPKPSWFAAQITPCPAEDQSSHLEEIENMQEAISGLLAGFWNKFAGTWQWYALWLMHNKFIIGVSGVIMDTQGDVLIHDLPNELLNSHRQLIGLVFPAKEPQRQGYKSDKTS